MNKVIKTYNILILVLFIFIVLLSIGIIIKFIPPEISITSIVLFIGGIIGLLIDKINYNKSL